MSAQAFSHVIAHSKHKGGELLCLLMIANHAHADGTNAYPGNDTLARECRMSERQIRRIVDNLEASGELIVDRRRGRGRSHTFTVVMTTPAVMPTDPQPQPGTAQKDAKPAATPDDILTDSDGNNAANNAGNNAANKTGHYDQHQKEHSSAAKSQPDSQPESPIKPDFLSDNENHKTGHYDPLKQDIFDIKPDISASPLCRNARGTKEPNFEPVQQQESAPESDTTQTAATAAVFDFVSRMMKTLAGIGVETERNVVVRLVDRYGIEAVEKQVRWLPCRKPCNIRVLSASLRDDYEDPTARQAMGKATAASGEQLALDIKPSGPQRVTSIGKGPMKNGKLLAEIRRYGRAVVLKEMVDYHDQCRRGSTPDDVLSKQCEMIEFLTSATDEEIETRLTGPR